MDTFFSTHYLMVVLFCRANNNPYMQYANCNKETHLSLTLNCKGVVQVDNATTQSSFMWYEQIPVHFPVQGLPFGHGPNIKQANKNNQ